MALKSKMFGWIALVLALLPLTSEAVLVQWVELSVSDEYQARIVNARKDRIAKAKQAQGTLPGADSAISHLYLISFATRVDASAMIAEAEQYGLAVKEIHLSVGETQNAFPILPDVDPPDQLRTLKASLFDDLSARALELKQKISEADKIGEKSPTARTHWWNEELEAISAFQRAYGGQPFVASGAELSGPRSAVETFVTSTKIPVVAVELSSVGLKQFAIPLDVYRGFREAQ